MGRLNATREEWLESLTLKYRPLFEDAGSPIPGQVRVSVGLPSKRAFSTNGRVLGQCWGVKAARDGVPQIYVSPVVDSSEDVASILVHELIHAAVGTDCGHKGPFVRTMKALGLTGKPTHAMAGPELLERIKPLLTDLGDYPHVSIDFSKAPKQGTRLLKLSCPDCGYTVRTTQKWLDVGLPTCVCGSEMESEARS